MASGFLTSQLRRDLECKAHGIDPVTNLRTYKDKEGREIPYVSVAEQQAAMTALYRLDKDEQERAAEEKRVEEAKRQALEAERQARQVQEDHLALEQRRLDLAEQEVAIKRADVVVRLLEVGAKGGLAPEQLLGEIRQLSDRLLPGPPPERRLLGADDK